MIQDQAIMRAVANILQRSERQQDEAKLVSTFVDVGILPQVENINNQIINGRRGTGKTHVFKVLHSRLNSDNSNVVVYIDMRTLGSTSQFSDSTIGMKQRCTSLFRDILGLVYHDLLEHIVTFPSAQAEEALEALDIFARISTEPVVKYNPETLTNKELGKVGAEASSALGYNTKDGFKIDMSKKNTETNEQERTTSYRVSHDDKVIFPELHGCVRNILEKANCKIYILFDEWSSLPLDIQPYLAEFIKRGFLANPLVTIKIASLEYRSNFSDNTNGSILGFELGGDISTALDIDDYYVYDRSPEIVTNHFAEMLLRHLRIELPENYLELQYSVSTGAALVTKMFTSKITFQELVRASEGVARDLINIFTASFFDAQRRGRDSIDQRAILESARQWFEKDKAQNLSDELSAVLRRIVDEVIGSRKARSFLLERKLERYPIIHQLFDARVIHLMRRGYADKENPGVRYNIYTLDYGTYVDLMNTSNKPQIELIELEEEDEEKPDLVVPFDDKRSIRRIVINASFFEGNNYGI